MSLNLTADQATITRLVDTARKQPLKYETYSRWGQEGFPSGWSIPYTAVIGGGNIRVTLTHEYLAPAAGRRHLSMSREDGVAIAQPDMIAVARAFGFRTPRVLMPTVFGTMAQTHLMEPIDLSWKVYQDRIERWQKRQPPLLNPMEKALEQQALFLSPAITQTVQGIIQHAKEHFLSKAEIERFDQMEPEAAFAATTWSRCLIPNGFHIRYAHWETEDSRREKRLSVYHITGQPILPTLVPDFLRLFEFGPDATVSHEPANGIESPSLRVTEPLP